MVVDLEADTMAVEAHVSAAGDALEEEVRVSVAGDALEEVRVLVGGDASAVAFRILVREARAFRHPERANLKLDPILCSGPTDDSRLNQRLVQQRLIVDQIGERRIRRFLRISHATVARCILPLRAHHEHFRDVG